MPPTQKSSGTTASLTPGAALTSLINTTGLANGENIVVWIDTSNLTTAQQAIVQVKRATAAAGTVRQMPGSPYTLEAGGIWPIYILGIPSGVPYTIDVGIIGGSAATLLYSIEQQDR